VTRVVAALVVVVVLLSACVPASPDDDTYRDRAALTLGSAVSEVRTILTLLDTLHDDRMLRPAAVAQLRYSESALETDTASFTELNPPVSQDQLHGRASTLLGDAGDLAAEARIAVERKDEARYPDLVSELDRLARDLERLEGRVS
jgi:hypothetical protein